MITKKEVHYQELYSFLWEDEERILDLRLLDLEAKELILLDQKQKHLKVKGALGLLYLRSICLSFSL